MPAELLPSPRPKELLAHNPTHDTKKHNTRESHNTPISKERSANTIKSRAKIVIDTLGDVGLISPTMDTMALKNGQELAVLPLSRKELNDMADTFDQFREDFQDLAEIAEQFDYNPDRIKEYLEANPKVVIELNNSESVTRGITQIDSLISELGSNDEQGTERVSAPKTVNQKIILMTRLANELTPWQDRIEDSRTEINTKRPEITRDQEGNLDKVYFDAKSLTTEIVREIMNLDNKWVLYGRSIDNPDSQDGLSNYEILYNTRQLLKDLKLDKLTPDELKDYLSGEGNRARIRFRRNEIAEKLRQKLSEVGGVFCIDFKHPEYNQDLGHTEDNPEEPDNPIEPPLPQLDPLPIESPEKPIDFGDQKKEILGNFEGEDFLTPESYRQIEEIARQSMDTAMDALAKAKNRRESIWSSIHKLFGRGDKLQTELESVNSRYQEAKIQYQYIVAMRIVATRQYMNSPEYVRYAELMRGLSNGQVLDQQELADFSQIISRMTLPRGEGMSIAQLSDIERFNLILPQDQLANQDQQDRRKVVLGRFSSVFDYAVSNQEQLDLLVVPLDQLTPEQRLVRDEVIARLDQVEDLGELNTNINASVANIAIMSADELRRIEDRQLDKENMTRVQQRSLFGDWFRRHPFKRTLIGTGMLTAGVLTGGAAGGAMALSAGILRAIGGYWGITGAQKTVRNKLDNRKLEAQIDYTKSEAIAATIKRLFPDTQDKNLQNWVALNYEFLNNLANGSDLTLVNNAIVELSAISRDAIERDTNKVRHRKMFGVGGGLILGAKFYHSYGDNIKESVVGKNPKGVVDNGTIVDTAHSGVTEVPTSVVESLDPNRVLFSFIDPAHGKTHEIADIFHQHVTGWDSLPQGGKKKLWDSMAYVVEGRPFFQNPNTEDWLWQPGAKYELTIGQIQEAIKRAGLGGVLKIDPSTLDLVA